MTRGYLTQAQLDAMAPGARVIDEDGDTLERRPDGRWLVVAVPDGNDPARIGDVWPARFIRGRHHPSRR